MRPQVQAVQGNAEGVGHWGHFLMPTTWNCRDCWSPVSFMPLPFDDDCVCQLLTWKIRQHQVHNGSSGHMIIWGTWLCVQFLLSPIASQKLFLKGRVAILRGQEALLQNPNGLCCDSLLQPCQRLQTTYLYLLQTLQAPSGLLDPVIQMEEQLAQSLDLLQNLLFWTLLKPRGFSGHSVNAL